MTAPTRLLLQLIALPSINPAFIPAGDTRAGEKRVAEFLANVAEAARLDVEWQQVQPERANLIVRFQPSGQIRRRVLLAPHMDTVGVAGDAQLRPFIKNGRLYGRGACDTKGSIAVMLSALLELVGSSHRPVSTEIVFVALVDEEASQAGSRFFAKTRFKADLAIVGEPTGLQVVTAHKGDLWLQLETHGKAAHGSKPHLGNNAIHQMAKVVDLLETRYARSLRRRKHRVLGHPTINVGTIAGGRQPNIVPDRCTIHVDRRTIPGEKDSAVKREILAFLKEHGLNATMIDTKDQCPAPPMEADVRLPLVQQLLKAAGQRKPAGVDYFTDAGVLAASGIPSVVFGPGDIAQAHTSDEWVEVRQLEEGTALLGRYLQSLP